MKKRSKNKSADLVSGQTRIATILSAAFDIPVTKQSIHNWQHRCDPPFPSPTANGKYSRKECFAWMEKYKAKEGPEHQTELKLIDKAFIAKQQREIDRQERERFELDKERGMFIPMDEARREIVGTIKKYHAMVRSELEKNAVDMRREKLKLLGVSAEQVAAFYEFDLVLARESVDRVEQWCERESK